MPPKTRQLSGQQSLKASWTAAKNVKGGVEAKKAVVSAPAPLALNIKQTAPAPAPAPAEVAKKPVKKRKSLTSDDEDSSVESEFESPIEEFEEDNVAPIEVRHIMLCWSHCVKPLLWYRQRLAMKRRSRSWI